MVSDLMSGKTKAGFVLRPVLALMSGVLLVLSAPGIDLSWLAWIALVPLLFTLWETNSRKGFLLGYLAGLVFFLGNFRWIKVVEGVGWFDYFLLGIIFAIYLGLFGLGVAILSRNKIVPGILFVPMLWVAMEFVRCQAGFMGLPIALLAHSQHQVLPVIQIAAITGEYGVSFLIALVNATLFQCLHQRRMNIVYVLPTTLLLGVSLAYGYNKINADKPVAYTSVTVIQGNIAQENKWERHMLTQHMEKHIRLSKESSVDGVAQLVVWPEGSIAAYLYKELRLLSTVKGFARELNTHLLIGASQRPKIGAKDFQKKYTLNTAYLISPQGDILDSYHKRILLPFAEYLPLKGIFPWPESFATRADNFVPGEKNTVFSVGDSRFSTAICWESLFSDHMRGLVNAGAQFILNIGNEAWFGDSVASYQLMAATVFRAVENGTVIGRATNTGVSGFIGPDGAIISTVQVDGKELFVEGFSTVDVPLRMELTFYTVYGDIFAWVVVGLVIMAMLQHGWIVMKHSRLSEGPR